ncbi:LytR/AlgR family response regulator transcription factor [Winogradskyella thalassocola]|uniref:Two component transcriptional regulator, LytTR family n=1 Tax=Winogradskyella thalassocola TaxID=262004 RepID=A0A1G8D4Z5_9FLAO|nr:LytTR family DNA-binding domain-containing protein [Winogradskyella thalassocola]SDH52772.1 two component transcriptional regulator, LytTR family [Winogradskyella thalassocola]
MIDAIIIEDEDIAAIKLQKMIQELDQEIHIKKILSSVKESVEYLSVNTPDLIFLDINLSDGNSFEIFNLINDIKSKIIFTTAYSEYAIKAFEQNSIDYLLKPIPKVSLRRSLEKLKKYSNQNAPDYTKIFYHPIDTYKKRFLVKMNNVLVTIEVDDIAYLYSEDKLTFIKKKNNKRIPIDYSLKKLEEILNPSQFYRVNRKYMVHRKAISKMYYSSKSKIILHLDPTTDEEQVPVAIEKTGKFKKWLSY